MLLLFQSTLPRGSDQAAQSPLTQAAIFQSTLPRGSDRVRCAGKQIRLYISIHAPSRERQKSAYHVRRLHDFNPRSLAGATNSAFYEGVTLRISIHAPSRERLL